MNMKSPTLRQPLRALAIGLIFTSGIALSAASIASEHDCEHGMHHGPMTVEKMREMQDMRMRQLHDKLTLSADQAPAWTEFETQMKPKDEPAMPDFEALENLPAPERMTRKLELMKAHHAWMESRIPVVTAFYGKLNPAQKKTFDSEFMHFGRGHHASHESHHQKPAP
jgi:periplasmic protein CpxP/Spy